MNNSIRGIVIDPGHGGDDPGAIGNGIVEKEYTLKISKYMYDRFKELGIPVVLTRDSDITLTPTERVNKVKNAFGNYKDVLVISNHINAGGGDGAEVIYALRNDSTLSNDILSKLAQAGQNVRGAYQRRSMVDNTKDYYFMQRNTSPLESVTIEYGFLDSKADDVNQLKNYWKVYAEAATQGILNYINDGNEIDNSIYIVKAGDNLYSIANKYNVSVDELKQINGLTSNNLSIGQRIKIPMKDNIDTSNYYIVKPLDTLYSIANKYNMSVQELKSINNLNTDNLYVGQKLLLVPENISEDNIYIVKLGDTLYSIAKRYNISVKDLIDANGIDDNIIVVGQQLVITVDSNNNDTDNYYIVKSGDTLYSIARRFNTTVNEIQELNGLVNNILSIGQELKIPMK